MTSTLEHPTTAGRPGDDGGPDERGPVTMRERWRKLGFAAIGVAVALAIGAVVHRISGALEVDRRFWTIGALTVATTLTLSFCFPRWSRYPTRPARPGDWPRTAAQKVVFGVLMAALLVALVTIGYFRLAD